MLFITKSKASKDKVIVTKRSGNILFYGYMNQSITSLLNFYNEAITISLTPETIHIHATVMNFSDKVTICTYLYALKSRLREKSKEGERGQLIFSDTGKSFDLNKVDLYHSTADWNIIEDIILEPLPHLESLNKISLECYIDQCNGSQYKMGPVLSNDRELIVTCKDKIYTFEGYLLFDSLTGVIMIHEDELLKVYRIEFNEVICHGSVLRSYKEFNPRGPIMADKDVYWDIKFSHTPDSLLVLCLDAIIKLGYKIIRLFGSDTYMIKINGSTGRLKTNPLPSDLLDRLRNHTVNRVHQVSDKIGYLM